MLSNWLARVGSAIPRGFSRHYILGLLDEEPMTGKEIIDKAIFQSGGRWKPSPGLIYPMLGRLLEEGLISETDSGKYKITARGMDIAADVDSVHHIMTKTNGRCHEGWKRWQVYGYGYDRQVIGHWLNVEF